MANIIKFIRGAEADIPVLNQGEPAFTTDTHKVFIGDGAENHQLAGIDDVGETNTASNIGSEVEIFKQKDGVDLEFRTLKANSSKIIVDNEPTPDVDIGSPAIDGNTSYSGTLVDKNNPANYSGTITSVELWANEALAGCKIATFFVESGNNLTTRDYETIQIDGQDAGVVPAGSKQTASVSLDVEEGDYIGLYFTAGKIDINESGALKPWFTAVDNIPCENVAFDSFIANYQISLYGTGVTSHLDYIKFDVDAEKVLDDLVASERLLSTTTVSFAADADTTLYTVPTGKRCVLFKAIVVAADDAGATTTISIGANGSETDFIPANTLSNLDAQYDSVILQPIPNTTPLKIKSYAAATVIEARVASNSGAAGNTVYLYGILY